MQTKESTSYVNIPLEDKLLNKYARVQDIFDDETNILRNDKKILNISNFLNINVLNLKDLKVENLKAMAWHIFNEFHNINVFRNDMNYIVVTKHGIEESVEKIFYNRFQRKLCLEHLLVFSKLGYIIENAILVSQTFERKGRADLLFWNYYLDIVCINGKFYLLEFDVRSMKDGSNQYRIQV